MTTLTKTTDRPSTTDGERSVSYLTPPANIRETADGYLVEAEMPGVGKDGLEVTIESNELVIIGRRPGHELKGEWVYRESRPLDFRRVFELDASIDTAKITAHMDQGVLILRLPKAESVKPRKIPVD